MIDEDFDLQQEMSEGLIIQDAEGTGYDLYHYGKHVAYASEWKLILKAVVLYMSKSNYYPGLFYVNERGSVDLLSLFRRGKGYSSKIIRSWV